MGQIEQLQDKADTAQYRAKYYSALAGTAAVYAVLSIPHPDNPYPGTPKGISFQWLMESIHGINTIVSLFTHNHISPEMCGVIMGGTASLASGLYSRNQRKKMDKFQTQANELMEKSQPNFTNSKGLDL